MASEPRDGVTTTVPSAPLRPDAAEPYRPMSGLAMTGFGLAALFAVVVLAGGVIAVAARRPRLVLALLVLAPLAGALAGVLARKPKGQLGRWAALALLGFLTALGLGGLIAFTSDNPWDLPWLAWALPVAAVLVCWMAQSGIARSEGTLEGAALASWGMRLALFFALIYGAYSLANSFAVRNQARVATDELLAIIATGDLQQAFLRGKPESSRPTAGARDLIEGENRARGASEPGPFSRFCEMDFVRLIVLGGKDNRFERLSVSAPTFESGSYFVEQIYKVTNPLATFELSLTSRSLDRVGPDGVKRRTWFVDLPRSRLVQITATDHGHRLEATNQAALTVAQRWLDATVRGGPGQAWLETLTPDDRAAMQPEWFVDAAWNASVRAMGFSPWLLFHPSEEYQDQLAAYEAAKLLDTEELWSVPDMRDRAIQSARRLFTRPPQAQPLSLALTPARLPLVYQAADGKARIAVTVRGVSSPAGGEPEGGMNLEGDLVLEAPAGAAGPDATQLRVRQFRLLRGHAMMMEGPPGR